jgi:hypothetical protein
MQRADLPKPVDQQARAPGCGVLEVQGHRAVGVGPAIQGQPDDALQQVPVAQHRFLAAARKLSI